MNRHALAKKSKNCEKIAFFTTKNGNLVVFRKLLDLFALLEIPKNLHLK